MHELSYIRTSMIFIYASLGELLYWNYTTQIRQTLLLLHCYDILNGATAGLINHYLTINVGYSGRFWPRSTSYLLSELPLDRNSHPEVLTCNFKELPYHEPRKDVAEQNAFKTRYVILSYTTTSQTRQAFYLVSAWRCWYFGHWRYGFRPNRGSLS